MHHHKKSPFPTPGHPASGSASALEARLEQAGAAADALRQILLDLAAACQQLRDQLPVPTPSPTPHPTATESNAKYPAAVPPPAATPDPAVDPAVDQLQRDRKIAAADTAAHRQRLAELNRDRLQWLRSHGAAADQIDAAEENGRRDLNDLQIAAARQSANQIQADLDRRQARPFAANPTPAANPPGDDPAAAPGARRPTLRADADNQARIAREFAALATGRALADQLELDQRKAGLLHLPVAMESGPNGNTVLNLGQLAAATGKTNAQIEGLLKGLLDHHYQLQNVILTLQSQLNTLQHQLQAQSFNRL
jgi:hypothetical protein